MKVDGLPIGVNYVQTGVSTQKGLQVQKDSLSTQKDVSAQKGHLTAQEIREYTKR